MFTTEAQRGPRPRWASVVQLIALFCVGCAGGGQVQLVSLDFSSIDPPPARVAVVPLDRCYWWTDEAGQVWVAMERTPPSLMGDLFRFEFQLSLVFEKLPAGEARNYTVRGRELRARMSFGPGEARFVSTAGIAALYRARGDLRGGDEHLRGSADRVRGGDEEHVGGSADRVGSGDEQAGGSAERVRGGGRLRGSVRIQVARQLHTLLGDWSRPVRYLLLATFDAVYDEQRGRAIAARTEEDGFERPTLPHPPPAEPTTRPASTPVAPPGGR